MQGVINPPKGTTGVDFRGYIPEGEEPTAEEKARFKFGRSPGEVEPSFVPGPETKVFPLGSAESQISEAMRVAKELNRKEQSNDAVSPAISRMDSFPNISAAIAWLDDQSQHVRELHLRAEKLSKDRKTLLAYYGWN
jgi:hypothetical protein